MAHTINICTPTPIAQACYNINFGESSKPNYFSLKIKSPIVGYTYVLPNIFKQNTNNIGVTSTMTLGTIDQLNNNMQNNVQNNVQNNIQNNSSIETIQKQLDIMNSLLKNTQINADQCLQKMNYLIDGVSSGMEFNHNPMHNDFANIIANLVTFDHIDTHSFDFIKSLNNDNDQIKCKCCRINYRKNYLRENKLYWCQMCSIGHIFTPYKITDFAPFDNIEQMTSLNEEMKNQHNALYHFDKTYWRN